MQLPLELAQDVETRIKQVLKGRNLRSVFPVTDPSTPALKEQSDKDTVPVEGIASSEANGHEVKLDCDVSQALTCLARHFRALKPSNSISAAERSSAGMQENITQCQTALQTTCSSRDASMLPSSLVMLHSSPQTRPRHPGHVRMGSWPVGATADRRHGPAGCVWNDHGPLPHVTSRQDAQDWVTGVVASLVRKLAHREAESTHDGITSAELGPCCPDAGNDNAGQAAVNNAPSWHFAVHSAGRPCRKITRSGTCLATNHILLTPFGTMWLYCWVTLTPRTHVQVDHVVHKHHMFGLQLCLATRDAWLRPQAEKLRSTDDLNSVGAHTVVAALNAWRLLRR